jgi:hypothetical protein
MPDDATPNLVLGDLLWRWAEYDAMSELDRWWIDDHRFLSVPETRELLQRETCHMMPPDERRRGS